MNRTKRAALRTLAAAGLAGLVLGTAGGASAQGQPIVLKGIVPYHPQNYLAQPLFILQKMLDERSKGQIKIQFIGGEEVVKALEQFDAVRNGVADISLAVASYYTGTVPEALAVQYNQKLLPSEMRKNGFYDLMRKIHLDKGNVIYLANASGTPGRAFRLYSKKKIDKADLTGMKIRVSPVYTALVQGLGGTPVSMPPADVYSALERGVVDGYGWTYAGIMDYSFQEVAKYAIDPPFYSLNSAILMNRAAYEKLPPAAKATLEEVAKDFETVVANYYSGYIKEEDAKLKAKGIEVLTLPPAEAAKYLDVAYKGGWADFLAKNPVDGPKLKALTE
jgi:TRAP-type C4-dicarboxylate transport system substrate-binding protein